MSSQQNITAIISDKRGRILSIGKNSYVKTHTRMKELGTAVGRPEKTFLHAEVSAIIRCKNLKKAHKIFVSRVMQNGEYGLAKPCPVCERAIKLAGIKIVEYT
jgi:deoxycytidylate deaminase